MSSPVQTSGPDGRTVLSPTARQKIAAVSGLDRVPPDHELPARWAAALATVHLLLNEAAEADAIASALPMSDPPAPTRHGYAGVNS